MSGWLILYFGSAVVMAVALVAWSFWGIDRWLDWGAGVSEARR